MEPDFSNLIQTLTSQVGDSILKLPVPGVGDLDERAWGSEPLTKTGGLGGRYPLNIIFFLNSAKS